MGARFMEVSVFAIIMLASAGKGEVTIFFLRGP